MAEPRKLTKRDLALAVPPHMRDLPAHVIEAEMARRRQMLERFDVLNPRFRRRLKLYVIGAVIFLPLFSWFVTPVGFKRLWLQIPLAALFGGALAATRASGLYSVALCILYGAIHFFVVGGIKFSFYSPGLFIMMAMTLLFWTTLGWALGTGEDLKRYDGD
ncbi:MAG: hypothetical protein QNJ98_19990 [Planctomycetota bacterium]|nr:hypothetical protein [Planctomycetota bacterium]